MLENTLTIATMILWKIQFYESPEEHQNTKKKTLLMEQLLMEINGTITQSNYIHIDLAEDLLSLRVYDGRDDVNNSRVYSVDNLFSENAVNLNNSADDEVSSSEHHQLQHIHDIDEILMEKLTCSFKH